MPGPRDGRIEVEAPLVSIVVPVFNRAAELERSLGSLIAQSYKNIEIIVVDDFSSDFPEAVLDRIADPRIIYIRRQFNGGAAAARNTGVEAAKGVFIAFHDSDDICVYDKVARQVSILASAPRHVVGVFCPVIFYADVDENSYSFMKSYVRPFSDDRPLSGDLTDVVSLRNPVNLPTLMVRREAFFSAGGFDPVLRNNEDWDFSIRIAREGELVFLPEPMYLTKFRSRPDIETRRISRSVGYSARSYLRISRKLCRQGAPRRVVAGHYSNAASFLFRLGKYRSARRVAAVAVMLWPSNARMVLKALLMGFPRLFSVVSTCTWRRS